MAPRRRRRRVAFRAAAGWTAPIEDGSGFPASTTFDFLGDGTADAMYADEVSLFVFGDAGQILMTSPRSSFTQWEPPIVVDVDNDASTDRGRLELGLASPAAPPFRRS